MTVHFVGAGPGAPDLITVRAQRLLEQCSVCLYAGSLVPAEILAHCPPAATLIDTADLTLDEIVAAMAAADAQGLDVVRLCSGDPAVLTGRIAYSLQLLLELKRPVLDLQGEQLISGWQPDDLPPVIARHEGNLAKQGWPDAYAFGRVHSPRP